MEDTYILVTSLVRKEYPKPVDIVMPFSLEERETGTVAVIVSAYIPEDGYVESQKHSRYVNVASERLEYQRDKELGDSMIDDRSWDEQLYDEYTYNDNEIGKRER